MKALVLKEYNSFVYQDVPKPSVALDEVLIRVEACSICGSDVHGMDGSTGRRIPPIIMGHEASGVIIEKGTEVTGWNVGDRVTFDSTLYCGECEFCRRGEVNLCDNRRVLGVSCEEYRCHGAFAEYVAVNKRVLYKLPESVSFVQAAMIEPLSIAVHAVNRAGELEGKDVAVVGVGMIGLLITQALTAKGCKSIIALDIDDAKLDMALRFGANERVNMSDSSAVNTVLTMTAGRGVDISFEVVGIEKTANAALELLRKGGAAVFLGNITAMEQLPVQAIVTRQLSLLGSCASAGEYDECIELIADKRLDVEAFVSAIAPLSEGADWFGRLQRREGNLMKVILRPGL